MPHPIHAAPTPKRRPPMAEPARLAPRDPDDELASATRLWLRRLPADRRPTGLCAHFPRLANGLARCWADLAAREQTLDDLIEDRRGGREGFPAAIAQELQRLRDYDARQHHVLPGPPWWRAMVKAVRN